MIDNTRHCAGAGKHELHLSDLLSAIWISNLEVKGHLMHMLA
jgi:hypothetical protein